MKNFHNQSWASRIQYLLQARDIGDNIRLVFNIVAYADHQKMPGAVLLVDLHKAYDSLNWSFYFCYVKMIWFWQFFD